MDTGTSLDKVGVVVIGRNEAWHLKECIKSVPDSVACVVYVDSQSIDGSSFVAASLGLDVIELDDKEPLNAARARNTGFCRVMKVAPQLNFVQFLDGDCALDADWLPKAVSVLKSESHLGAVWGHQHERWPDKSIYNKICDMEWKTPSVGEVLHFGGNVLMRVASIKAVGGYDEAMVASEDQELSTRILQFGWRIRRIDVSMAMTDSRMTRLGQWWLRCVRRGVGYAQMWERHRRRVDFNSIMRFFVWAGLMPIAIATLLWPTRGFAAFAFGIYPLSVLRITFGVVRRGGSTCEGFLWASHCVASSLPYFVGFLAQTARQFRGKRTYLIEYRRKI